MDELPGEVKQAEQLTVADVKRWHWGLEHGDVWDIFFSAVLVCFAFVREPVGVTSSTATVYGLTPRGIAKLYMQTWKCRPIKS